MIHKRLKEARLQNGYTLLEVAEKLGVKEATVQRYESGEIKNIKHSTISRLAEIYMTTPAYLMGWEEDTISPLKQTLIKKIEVMTDDELQKLEQIIALVLKD